MNKIKKFFLIFVLFSFIPLYAHADVLLRIGELLRVKGLRTNQLIGYGLVVGLNGTGDSQRFPLTQLMIHNFIRSLGHSAYLKKNKTRNIAAVLVTAKIPPFSSIGNELDLRVASIGDARSLEAGMLIRTPLYGGDGKIYGTGQGLISILKSKSSHRRGPRGNNLGVVIKGGILEQELAADFFQRIGNQKEVILILHRFSFVHAKRINRVIRQRFKNISSNVIDGSHIRLILKDEPVNALLGSLLELKVNIPDIARVVLDEKSGVVVIGSEVKISPVVISVQGLFLPNKTPSDADLYLSEYSKEKKGKSLFFIEKTSSVKEIANKLNEIGATTKDLIVILKAINAGGALHGELIIR